MLLMQSGEGTEKGGLGGVANLKEKDTSQVAGGLLAGAPPSAVDAERRGTNRERIGPTGQDIQAQSDKRGEPCSRFICVLQAL